jgi:hypothetical protein
MRAIIHLQYFDPYFTGSQFDLNNSTIRTFIFDTRTRAFYASRPGTASTV